MLSGNFYHGVERHLRRDSRDALASNLNPDDPNQVDNNLTRLVSVLGIAHFDLTVTDVSALTAVDAGGAIPLALPFKIAVTYSLVAGPIRFSYR